MRLPKHHIGIAPLSYYSTINNNDLDIICNVSPVVMRLAFIAITVDLRQIFCTSDGTRTALILSQVPPTSWATWARFIIC